MPSIFIQTPTEVPGQEQIHQPTRLKIKDRISMPEGNRCFEGEGFQHLQHDFGLFVSGGALNKGLGWDPLLKMFY